MGRKHHCLIIWDIIIGMSLWFEGWPWTTSWDGGPFDPFISAQARPYFSGFGFIHPQWIFMSLCESFFPFLYFPQMMTSWMSNFRTTKKKDSEQRTSKWFQGVGSSNMAKFWNLEEAHSSPLTVLQINDNHKYCISCLFIVYEQGNETKRDLCDYWVTLMGKIKWPKNPDKQKTWVSGPHE